MNKSNEKYLERQLKNQTEVLGALCIKLLPFQMAGLPDRMILKSGKAFFAEIKTKGQKLRPVQKTVHNMFKKVGFKVWLIDSEMELFYFLEHILEETK